MTAALVPAMVALAVVLWPMATRRRLAPPGRGPGGPSEADASSGGGQRSVARRLVELRRRLTSVDRAVALAEEAAYCEMLALGLRAGLPSPAALAIADGGARPDGGAPTRGGRLLALAWAQSEALGTPLADAVETCAAARQADHDHELERRSAASGPKASMWLLTALPVAGPALATLVGLGPQVGDPVVVGMLAAGLGATASGWWWARSLIARAERPVRVHRPDQGRRLGSVRPVRLRRPTPKAAVPQRARDARGTGRTRRAGRAGR